MNASTRVVRSAGGSSAGAAQEHWWRTDPLRLALFALTVLTISRIHQHFGPLTALRPALLLAGFAIGAAVLNPRWIADGRWLRTWPARVVAALGAWACVSAWFGISLGHSAVFIIGEYSKVLVYAGLLMAVMARPRDLRLYVWAFVVSTGVLTFLAVFTFDLEDAGGLARLDDLYTYDSNDLGCVLMVGLALTLLTFQTSTGRGRVFSALVLVGIGMAIARSGSRGAFVGLVATALALLFMVETISIAKRVGFIFVTVVALLIAAPPGYWDQMKTLQDPTADYNWNSRSGRKQLAVRGLGYMMAHPIFGIGIDNFEMAEGTVSGIAREWKPGMPGIRWSAPHNSFIQAGAELGIPGLLLWSSLVFGGIFGLRRLRRRLPRAWLHGTPDQRFVYLSTIYMPVAFVGFAITSSFVSFAYLDLVYVLAAYTVGVYLSADGIARRDGGTPIRRSSRPARPIRGSGGRRSFRGPAHADAAAAQRRP